jgi:hypothetical protein
MCINAIPHTLTPYCDAMGMAHWPDQVVCVTGDITHTLKAEGFDASEDGTGRGQPIVAATLEATAGRSRGAGTPVGMLANVGMAVRRLTPRECERLQGFPSIRKEITIWICIDHQKSSATVALSCRKWPTDALPAAVEKWMPSAPVAALASSTSQAGPEPHAALRVRTNSVDELLEIRSHGKSIWSASSAVASSKYPLSTPTGDIATALAQAGRALAQEITAGKAASQASIRLSMPAQNGEQSVQKSGAASAESASDATSDAQPARFTTSELGRATPMCDSTAATLLCSALAVISSCIPSEILPANFSLILDIETPYTLVPVRSKPAADGPRYKALGNSWAVPVVRWIGRRIDAALRSQMLEAV